MPAVEIITPDGSIERIQFDTAPTMQDINDAEATLLGTPPEQDLPDQPDRFTGSILRDIGFGAPPTPEARQLDIQEKGQRLGFIEGTAKSVVSAGTGVMDLISSVGTGIDAVNEFRKNPSVAGRKIGKALKSLDKDSAGKFLKGAGKLLGEIALDTLETASFDPSRPGNFPEKFDFDVFLNKIQNRPISTVGDFLLLSAAPGLAAKSADKIARMKILKRSGPQMKSMAKDLVAIQAQATTDAAAIKLLSPGQKVAAHGDLPAKIGMKNLDLESFAKNTSVKISDQIIDIGKSEGKKMSTALNKVAKKEIDTTRLSTEIKDSLVSGGFADTAKEAVDTAISGAATAGGEINVIAPLNKRKLSQFLEILDGNKTMTVKDLKNTLDIIDDSINWVAPRSSDKGLKIMRAAIRNELGAASPAYDKIATRIHDRLTELGYVEKKIKKGSKEGFLRKYKEDIGQQIALSDERTDAFREAMKIVSNESSAKALGQFDALETWVDWNELYGQNKKFLQLQGDEGGRGLDAIIRNAQKRIRLESPGFPEKVIAAKQLTGSALGSTLRQTGNILRGVAIGDTLFDRNQRDPDE